MESGPIRHIAIVCTLFPIPTETFVLSQVTSFLSGGMEVDVFPYIVCSPLPGAYQDFQLDKRVFGSVIPPKHYGKRFTGALRLLWQHRRHFFRLIKTLNVFVLGKPAADLTVFYGAIAFLNKPKYDVILANFGENGMGMEKLIRSGFLKAPLITFFYGYDIYKNQIVAQNPSIYQELFHRADFLVGVSRHMCLRLAELGCARDKIIYLPCPPNDHFLTLKPDYSGNIMLAIGRFVEKKAPHLTIQAFSRLQNHEPDAALIMVGDGPLLNVCEGLVESLGLSNVIFTGTLPHEKTEKLFENAFCFLQHSVTAENGDSEGTPVSVLEAGAAGLPVVSTLHGGIPDVVINHTTGFLVEEGDVEGMAAAMLRLYHDRNLCRQMGVAARGHILEHFSMEKYMAKLNQLLAKSIKKLSTG